MKESQTDSHELNIQSMILHASAFSLFAVSVAVYTGFYVNNLCNETSQKALDDMLKSAIALNILSFFAQCLLIVIFVQLGTKQTLPETDETHRNSRMTLTSVDDDEESQMQAHAWILFVRERKGW